MDAIVARLEGLVARIAGGGGDDGDVAVTVSEYDSFYTNSVQPFIDACNAEDDTKKLGAWTETAFKRTRVVLEGASQCKKPDQGALMTFLGPIVTVITDAQNVDNRAASFAQDKAYAEAIQCLNFLLADGPKTVVSGALDSADFYLNKTLTVARDKEDPAKTNARNFVKTIKTLLADLAAYCHEFHKTGVMWKFSGGDVGSFTPGQKAAGGAGGATTPEGKLEAVCDKLEAYAAKLKGGDDEDGPLCVSEYKAMYTDSVQPFVDACNKFPELSKMASWTETAFKHAGVVIAASTECKKPDNAAFMAFLGPLAGVIGEAGDIDRKSTFAHQYTAYNETVQALNFLCMEGGPKAYILSQVEAGSFYSNKVLVAAKDQEDPAKSNHRAWVKTMKEMLEGLAAYAHEHFKMGVVWNVKGKDLSEYKAPAGAAAAAAAAPAATPAPAAATPAPAAAAPAAAAPAKKKLPVFGSAVSSGPKEGTIDTSKTDKIFIDNYDGKVQKEPLVVKAPETDKPTTGVFIGKCNKVTIVLEGKIKNLTLSACTETAVVFDNCVTTVEVIASKKCQIQAKEAAGSYIIDKSDRTTLYLADGSAKEKVVLVSCMSTATNVCHSTEDGEDQEEHGVPDQIESMFTIGKGPQHKVVIPDAE